MTKIVKEYVEEKIREGAAPKRKVLEEEYEKVLKAQMSGEELDKLIYASKEFKALEALIRKLAKENDIVVKPAGYRSPYLVITSFDTTYTKNNAAREKLYRFDDKLAKAIREALVELELLKSKADVEAAIAKAVAALK